MHRRRDQAVQAGLRLIISMQLSSGLATHEVKFRVAMGAVFKSLGGSIARPLARMTPPAKDPSINDDPQQTRRILDKLSQARAADPKLKVFGADSHGYVVHAPASPQTVSDIETRLAITLPDAYRRFVLEIGNGGDGYHGSAAGPFYGIYGVANSMNPLELDWLAKVVANPCILTPGMCQPDWVALVDRLGLRSDLDDDAHEAALATLFGGLLPVGSQGCSYCHGLVVNGPYAGRVVNYDMDLSAPPVFALEPDFLAWYERWLDEVIAGDLLQKGPSWFGYTRGGPEVELLAGWLDSEDAQTAQQHLAGLLSKKRLSDATLNALAQHRPSAWEHRSLVCQIVCKHNHAKARPLLAELAAQEPLAFLQCLHWYARDQAPQAERYPEERDYVLVNLDHRLKELGTSRAALLRAPAGDAHGTGLGAVVRHWASQLVGRRS